ncbi:MAG: hypothetical protein K6T87_16165 [Roseiflexus sp.]|uniref:hypothetical protein n=1 Tax=Roseiflexus sp. TaxID=2562120 RepID=UPI0025E6C53F|nr:hypothetical protein [Roseiflexus sp.]MCL6542092.1 hypothetical protein [Roseiflexus sp.]
MSEKESRAKFVVETIRNKRRFDPRSFRTTVARAHRLTFGCPKGYWDEKKQICKVPVELQRILHPVKEFVQNNPCPYVAVVPERRKQRKNPVRDVIRIEKEAVKLFSQGYGKDWVADHLRTVYGLTKDEARYFARRAAAITRGARKFVAPEVKKAVYPVLALNPRLKWYVGFPFSSSLGKVFSSDKKPIKSTHGHLFRFVTGPFKTKEEAVSYRNLMATV